MSTEPTNGRFNILVCIDGSEASYRGLRYATRFSLDHDDTDISLLYIRSPDDTNRLPEIADHPASGNMFEWKIELPGLKKLETARDILVDLGFLGKEWHAQDIHTKARGTHLGDHRVDYISNRTGQHIRLIVRVAEDIVKGILDEAHFYDYQIVIVSASNDMEDGLEDNGVIDLETASKVALKHDGTVILARQLEEGHGHLVCVTDSTLSKEMALKDARFANSCGCPIHLYYVAEDEQDRGNGERTVAEIKTAIEAQGFGVLSAEVEVGEPVWRITEKGKKHSLIVLTATEKTAFQRLWTKGSVSHEVLKKARNSVMIVRQTASPQSASSKSSPE